MKASQLVTPTPEIIQEIKQSYNRVLKRCQDAERYLNDTQVPQPEKDRRVITFRVEVVDVLESYLKVLQDWSAAATDYEILNGFMV